MVDPHIIMQIMPFSWAAAVSPTSLSIFLILMSMSDNPKLSGLSFYLGAVLVLLITLFLGIVMGTALTNAGHSDPATIGAIDLFLGAILLLLGIKSLLSRKKENSSVMHYLTIDSEASNLAKFGRYFTLGVLTFLLNFSTAIFVLAAGRQIGLSKAGFSADAMAVIILTVIALLVIEVPLLFFILLPKTAERVTDPMDKWLSKHTHMVMAAFLLIMGLLVILNGLSHLHMV